MKTLLISSVAALLIATSYWVWVNYIKVTIEAPQAGEHYPDYFLKNFVLTSTEENGQTAYTLNGTKLIHYNDTRKANVTNPVIRFKKGTQSWEISALRGEMGEDQKTIHLHDNVLVDRKNASGNSTLTIETDYLRINTESKNAMTDKKVLIHTQNLTLSSIGLHYNSHTGIFKLLSNARGVYETQH